jgi:NAD(P)-dependent dehydrogenase (short-subunit alcohol dehydrogenase family)
VLITGGTSGIGRATVVAFAEQGAKVVIAGRRETEGAESVALVEKAGGNGLFVRTDVTREEEIAALVTRTVEHFGRLDFAFNNAGVGGEAGAGIANTGEVFDHIMDTNVRSVFFGMKHQIPAILQSGAGAIVNNASILGLRPNPALQSTVPASSRSSVSRNRWRSGSRPKVCESMQFVRRLSKRT